MRSHIKKIFIIILISVSLAMTAFSQVKQVQMKIDGYLCGN